MSESVDVSLVLIKPAETDGAFADQTLRNIEVVSSLDEARGTWVMFAPPFHGFPQKLIRQILLQFILRFHQPTQCFEHHG